MAKTSETVTSDRKKKLANEGASPVTFPESVAKHISAPVRLWSLKWRVLRDNLPLIGHH